MSGQAAETGAQLFSRLLASTTNKNSPQDQGPENSQLNKFNTQLESSLMLNHQLHISQEIFPGGLSNKTIVEIAGSSNTGKTELLYVLISRLLLPQKFKISSEKTKVVVNLEDYSAMKLHEEVDKMQKVILVETDSKFNFLRLFKVMETRVASAYCKQIEANLSPIAQTLLEKFIRECLKNLIVYKCISAEQLVLSLAACEYFIQNQLTNKNEIIPIFIDSINSNYEIIDKFSHKLGLNSSNHTENYTMTLIRKLVERYNVVIFATFTEWTAQVYSSNNSEQMKAYLTAQNKSYEKWHQAVERRIELYSRERQRLFRHFHLTSKEHAENNSPKVLQEDISFKIENSGFEIV